MSLSRAAIQPPTNAIPDGIKRNIEATKRMAMEKTSSELRRLLAGRNFDSLEAANQFLASVMAFKNSRLLEDRLDETVVDLKDGLISARVKKEAREHAESFLELSELWQRSESNLSDLERAQNVMYEAWQAEGTKRIELARQALAISADCADAYSLLAQEDTTSLQEACDLFYKAMETAERNMGSTVTDRPFWSDHSTRPYMRARADLASSLWILGDKDHACDHLRELLKLNPGDNQGLRFRLVNWLLQQSLDDEAEQLISEYGSEPLAVWKFSEALLHFRKTGATDPRTNQRLRDALSFNEFVAPFVLGWKQLPETMPAYIQARSVEEAVEYATFAIDPWKSIPGALDWLSDVMTYQKRRDKSSRYKLWISSIDAASECMHDAKFSKARRHFEHALRQAEKLEDDETIYLTLQRLCPTVISSGAKKEDEPIFVRNLSLSETLFGTEDQRYLLSLYTYGLFKLDTGELSEAELHLARAAELAEQLEDGFASAAIYAAQADLFRQQGKLSLSIEYSKRSKDLAECLERADMDDDYEDDDLENRTPMRTDHFVF